MKLAIFDFDGTIFQDETLPYILKYWHKHKYKKSILYKTYYRILKLFIKYKLKLDKTMDKEAFRGQASLIFLRLFEHMSKKELKQFFKECCVSMSNSFHPIVLEQMKTRKLEGYEIVVCSGAYEILLKHLRDYVHIDQIIGTKLHYNHLGYLDYEQPLVIVTGQNKPLELLKIYDKEKINWQDSYAYGDSYYDYEILTLTNNPVAVTPDDKLRSIAKENNWIII